MVRFRLGNVSRRASLFQSPMKRFRCMPVRKQPSFFGALRIFAILGGDAGGFELLRLLRRVVPLRHGPSECKAGLVGTGQKHRKLLLQCICFFEDSHQSSPPVHVVSPELTPRPSFSKFGAMTLAKSPQSDFEP